MQLLAHDQIRELGYCNSNSIPSIRDARRTVKALLRNELNWT